MNRQERLADTMTGIVVWLCVLFYAFAAGVWYDEHKAEPQKAEPVHPVTVIQVEEPAAEDTSSVTADAATPSPRGEGFNGLDPMIEDSYLVEDHPLSLENQMLLYGACLEMGVDYRLALAVVEQETGYRNLMGDDGESAGYMQVQEKWHQERMALLGVDDLLDPEGNFRVGCHFLKECIDKYGLEKGLGYYNSGKDQVTDYRREVLGRMG